MTRVPVADQLEKSTMSRGYGSVGIFDIHGELAIVGLLYKTFGH